MACEENNGMKIKRAILLILPISAFVLQLLPYGAVLNFANPEGEPFRRTYSYFSLVPVGYASFGPMLTGVLTCILLTLLLVWLFNKNAVLYRVAWSACACSLAASVTPVFYGIRYISVIGVMISVLLSVQLVMMSLIYRSTKKD